MEPGPTTAELEIYDDISRLAAELWRKSAEIEGLNTDPKMFSVMLFQRLWSNHRGFTLLWKNGLNLEADIILRAGIEAAICVAANYRMRDEFVTLMRADAAFTLLGQIKLHRTLGDQDLVRDGEANFRALRATLPEGVKHAKLDWTTLAERGDVHQLYDWHRMLSGISSHVTGLSVIRRVTSEGSEDLPLKLDAHTRRMRPMMMAGATLTASTMHAGMIDDADCAQTALDLTQRLNAVSWEWPGVEAGCER